MLSSTENIMVTAANAVAKIAKLHPKIDVPFSSQTDEEIIIRLIAKKPEDINIFEKLGIPEFDIPPLSLELEIPRLSPENASILTAFLKTHDELAKILGTDRIGLYGAYGAGASMILGSALILILFGLRKPKQKQDLLQFFPY
jgi:hypothetical protein